MRVVATLLLLLSAPAPAHADTLVAARTVRAQAIITPVDLAIIDRTIPGTLADASEAVGMESRVVLYAGRPIRPGDIGPPAIIDRNQVVTLTYRSGPLTIAAEARALGRAGIGDVVRVMNLASRNTVTGIVRADGTVSVGGTPSSE
ncbi:flagellar basal body P-ring formation chaperone FlgA [Pseudoruegeria sp. HB172150]|uniref:flagellar basal body P-ring formation chaperone FlgA n=1 Tax=Pseudoruegeria sp. HB172150 TaxID=2721164 RepID=UPI001558056C|nr:flagellar basal body P-ring formation chaperone FlgA [Pseudoruegeria sp. HB172150]